MTISLRSILLSIASAGLLAACAVAPFTPTSFTAKNLDTSAYAAKVEAFVVLMDASASMTNAYHGRQKFYVAKDVVTHMNQTIPELGYMSALAGFGTISCDNKEVATVVYGPATHQRAGFSNGLSMLSCAGGSTSMSQGINVGGGALRAGLGKVALILVSDFGIFNKASVIAAADKLKTDYGNRLCIHTIKVGNYSGSDDLIAALAGVNSCGSSMDADSLASPAAMADYVTDVLLKPAGVAVVKYEKSTLSASALFDHDKSILKEAGMAELRELDQSIRARGTEVVDINVIGHTDSDGTEEYNMGLSLRRATAVRDYLVNQGIDSSIIDTSGEGESNPVASNATREGRAQNRRVEIYVGIKESLN